MVAASIIVTVFAGRCFDLRILQFTKTLIQTDSFCLRVIWSLIGASVEELLFRGVIQTRLTARLASWLAILVTTVLFLAIHIPGWVILSVTVSASVVATVTLVGLICGVLRHRSGSLWPGVAAHWANNLGAML
ncbi:CPBP family intramembrane glutamic endopeptidase [Afipia massiliensis]|uniref:CPBP family intramembrane glutamic endopeptidase n=1 Tax=Afipia massiliensis TaxID=211460 RepID=UPI003D31F88C